MKKSSIKGITLVVASMLPTVLFANNVTNENVTKEKECENSKWLIETRITDSKLPAGDARVTFTCHNPEFDLGAQTITIQYNTQIKQVKTNNQGSYALALKPGKYAFTITQAKCAPVIENLEVKPRERISIKVTFIARDPNLKCEKPVIYLYPKKKTDVKVSVDPAGEFIFTYPAYNQGWNVTAHPDGTILHEGKKYNYLFWEANIVSVLPGEKNTGFVVSSDTLMPFLENSLTDMGLNSKEQQDFITYWYPQMTQNNMNVVRFLFNDECNSMAGLTITPEPDHIFRVYMIWMGVGSEEAPVLQQQQLPTFKRDGFTVVEWGGMKITHGVIAEIPDNN
jgi:hypothetical protein